MFYGSILKQFKIFGCHFTTTYWFAMKLCTDDLEGFSYCQKIELKFYKIFYGCINFFNMVSQDKI